MADKDFVVKNGLIVNGSVFVVNTGSTSVGINTTAPDATFKVVGTANVTGNVFITANLTVTGTMHGTANNALNLGGVIASSYALKTYADSVAATAYSNGVTYADGRAATAYSNAATYADSRAATAYSNAASYTAAYVAAAVPALTSNATTYVLGGGSVVTNVFTIGTTFYSVANGNIGFGVSAPTVKLDVSGAINATGDITSTSDLRLKTSIEKIENALDKVCKLNGVTFRMKDSDKKSTGLIAQDVREVMPEAVSTNAEEYMSVAYGNLMGLVVEAIKELKVEVDKLKHGN